MDNPEDITVADLINNLFSSHLRPDGREYTNKEVCDSLGNAIETSHLSRLRKGKIANPGRDTLLALCRFFRVPPSYFFPELAENTNEESVDPEMMMQIALRSSGVLPDVQQKLAALIRSLRPKD